MKRRGYTAQVVEHWNAFARRRVDLFGVVDVLALAPEQWPDRVVGHYNGDPLVCSLPAIPAAIVGIQACAGSSHAARRTKILAEPRAKQWLHAGGRLEIWSFSKTGPRGKTKRWTLRIEPITVDMFADTVRREQG